MSDFDSIRHQDAAGMSRSPLGVFDNGVLLEVVPAGDVGGESARARYAEILGRVVEVLLICHRHPGVAAVDCLICVPEDPA